MDYFVGLDASLRSVAVCVIGDEPVAEIGACILGVKLGIEPEFGQSAVYIEGWLRALKDDKG